jgi:transcriptional regulator with XRE-family HTH domain
MSQADLAERIDMSVSYISHIETAKKRASLESLVRIANALEITADHLLSGNQTNDLHIYQTDMKQIFEGCTSYQKRIICEIALAAKRSLHDNEWIQNKIRHI